eukprot:gene159-161_t
MLFGRKNLFSATDAFPLTDAVLEFDDSSSVAVRPGRRALDGFGPRGERSASSKWWAVAGLIGLYAVALAGFYALGVVGAQVLWVLAGLTAAGFAVFGAVFRSGLQRKLRLRHLKLGIVTTAIGGMLVVFYLEPVTQILLAPFMFVAVAYGIFTVPRRTLLVLTAAVLCAYAAVIAAHYAEQGNDALLRLELMHLLALAVSVPAFIVLMGRVQRLYRSLYQASRKIKNIQEDAQRDTLLGCFNRRYILAALEEQKQLADESGIPLCLQGVRGGDVFGRYGGEEFLLIFPATSLLPSLNTCERIRAQVESHAWTGLLKGRVTVSIGVTQYVLGESVLEFFSRADTAMYMAKEGGRNQVVVEEPIAKGDSQMSDLSIPSSHAFL